MPRYIFYLFIFLVLLYLLQPLEQILRKVVKEDILELLLNVRGSHSIFQWYISFRYL